MDPYSILDKSSGAMPQAVDASSGESPAQAWPGVGASPDSTSGEVRFPAEDGGRSLAEMAQRDLTATLQLLAERAQYITGSTGAAIALRDGEDMLCRASAGTSAPEVGAQLQVNSGLSGESVRTRQTLRCDDALTDERVNRESCEALGIRSVVVMPLLEGDQVVGVFELFSDKANVFEPRDITALERMGNMVQTALEHSAAALETPVESGREAVEKEIEKLEEKPADEVAEAGGSVESATPDKAAELGPDPTSVKTGPEEIVQSSSGDAWFGRVEEKAAATLGPTSGIAFHRRVPSNAAASPANTVETQVPAPEVSLETVATSAVESPELDSATGVHAEAGRPSSKIEVPSENADVLEMPVEVGIPELKQSAGDEVLDPALVAQVPEAEAHSPAQDEREKAEPFKPPSNQAGAAVSPVASLRKCEGCGFPVSEGRHLCLDCEKKGTRIPVREETEGQAVLPSAAVATVREAEVKDMLNFLAGEEEEASWMATHRLMVIAMVLAVVAIVVLLLVR